MHELSVANSIIEVALEEMTKRQTESIVSIGVRIGALTCVSPEALSFSFEAAIADTPLAGTKLVIEQVPVKGRCKSCSRYMAIRDFVFACPSCGSRNLSIKEGEELDIAYIEVR